jgi:hypothetical protein
MAQSNAKAGKHWTDAEKVLLRKLAAQNTPTRVIGIKLQRPEGGVRAMAGGLGVSLKPTNQSPYNRLKK